MFQKMINWRNVKGFLLDVYGVLYDSGINDTPIDGSIKAIHKLREAGVPFRMCSNTSTRTPQQVVSILRELGFDVREGEVFTTIPVAVDFIVNNNLRPFLIIDPCVKNEFDGIDQSDPNCVVLGDATHQFSFQNMNQAFLVLNKSPQNMLITLGTSKYYKEPEGLVLDCGSFVKTLEYAADRQSHVIGKPTCEYFNTAVASMGLVQQQVVMVGDDILGDVGGAQNAGIPGILVKTGKYKKSDETCGVKAAMYADNLLDVVENFFKHQS